MQHCRTEWRALTSWVKYDAARGARGLLFTSSRNIWTSGGRGRGGGGGGGGGDIVKQLSWIELRYSAFENRPCSDINARKMSSWIPSFSSSSTALQTTRDSKQYVLFCSARATLLCRSLFCTGHKLKFKRSSVVNKAVNVACQHVFTLCLKAQHYCYSNGGSVLLVEFG